MKATLLPLLLALGACGAITPAGLIAASRLDPLGTAPGDVAIAVAVPKALRLADGDATLRLSFLVDGAEAPAVDTMIPLEVRAQNSLVPAKAGMRAFAASIPPAHQPRMAAAQAEIRALRAAGTDGEGSLSIDISGGCLTEPLGDSLPISTWLRTDPEAGFVQLTRAQNARDLLSGEEYATLTEGLTSC